MSGCDCVFDEETSTLLACTQNHADAFKAWVADLEAGIRYRVELSGGWWIVRLLLGRYGGPVAAFKSWAEAIAWTTRKASK